MDYANFPIAFTQTVNSNFYLQKHPTYKQQFKESLNYLTSTFGSSVEAIIFPELTNNGIIHFHGFIRIVNYVDYMKAIYKLKLGLGYNCFKYIDNVEKWRTYCEKSKNEMEVLLGTKLPYIHIQCIKL